MTGPRINPDEHGVSGTFAALERATPIVQASYHTGLADGQNSTIEALRVLREYSAFEPAAVLQ